MNYTLGLSLKGNTGLQQRLQHAPDGTISLRADQAEYEKLFKNLNLQRHVAQGERGVGHAGPLACRAAAPRRRSLGYIVNDWQISGVLDGNSGTQYDLGYSYQNNGGNRNLTGSPDYGARIVYIGDPGSGCSDNQYRPVQRRGRDRSAVQLAASAWSRDATS